MLDTYDKIIEHAMSTTFVVTRPIYQDEKEQQESESGESSWPHIREGFKFTPEEITFFDDPHVFDSRGTRYLTFRVRVSVPREWVRYGWMGSPDDEYDGPSVCDVEDWYIDAADLVERCDEATAPH